MPSSINKTTSRQQVLLHVLGCTGFVILPFLFFPHPESLLDSLDNEPTIRDFIGQFLLIGFFYLNYYQLIPKYYHQNKHTVYTLLVALCFVIVLLLPSLFTGRFNHSTGHNRFYHQPHSFDSVRHGQPPQFDRKPPSFGSQPRDWPLSPPDGNDLSFLIEVSHTVFLFLIVLFFSLMLSSNNRWRQAQKEKTDAELSYLKAQINPHFLFNTLNSIYSLTIQKSDDAPEAVIKLAGMMRYVLQEANDEWVPLQKELDYVKDYVQLQQLRFGSEIPVDFTITGKTSNNRIAPLILINFIENAFKHGVNAAEDSYISIAIEMTGNSLILKVRNNKVQVQKSESSGTGLQNVKSRLQLLYPDKHELSIENRETYYSVILHLWLV